MEHHSGLMQNCLSHLVKTIIGSLPIYNPHLEQRREGQIIDLCLIHYLEPFSPSDHVRPKSIIKEEVRENIIPPPMVGSLHILPLLDNPMEGVPGNLENPPQCSFKQKQRGRLPHKSLGVIVMTFWYVYWNELRFFRTF